MRCRSARNGVSAVRNVKEILQAALTLTAIAAVVVAALAGTNILTRDAIAENERAATATACKAAFPAPDGSAYTYELAENPPAVEGVTELYEVKDGETLVGYVVKTVTKGKSRHFVMMTGVTVDGTVKSLSVVSQSETAGYVDKVKKGGLFDALLGANVQTQHDVDAVSNATKTSNAVKDGVELALQTVGEVQHDG